MRTIAAFVLATTLAAAASLTPAAAMESAPPGFPVTVENCGRMLTFDEPPSRVVTGYHPVFETAVALGLGEEQIIGRTNFSENGPDGFLPGQKAVYEAIPEISPEGYLPGKEALLALQPDFVITFAYDDFEASRGNATVEELADAGVPAYITGGWCDLEGIRTAQIANIFDDIRNLGLIFGIPERAARLAAEYQALIDDVEERVAGLEPVDVLATDGGDGPVNASARQTARRVAVVAQERSADFDFTVAEVVAMGRTPHKRPLDRD
ncbi:MAG: ABC transporter substrate-binding protein, partial [Egibacteraceae bacterium]